MRPPSRRQFLSGAVGAVAAAACPKLAWGARNQVPRFDILISGGRVVDPAEGIDGLRDIGILDGKVARVATAIPIEQGRQVIDARGKIITPGLIDVHVHVYDGVSRVSIEPDVIGVAKGVTSVIDGGSAGATTFPGFRTYVAQPARTRVFALLNISDSGMTVRNETVELAALDPTAAARTVRQNRDVIVGLKVRMLAGIPEGQDLEVMRRTRAAADLADVPIMVHIGGQTSPLPRVLDFLRPGDVVTHALRRQGSILDANGRIFSEVREAVANGIHLDIGHGRGNFDFDVAEEVLQQGLMPTTISSDVHRGNALGPVFGLPTTLSKFMRMGMPFAQVIEAATSAPARIFALGQELGTLAVGSAADVGIFELSQGDFELVDSGGKTRSATERIVPLGALRDGRPYGSITI